MSGLLVFNIQPAGPSKVRAMDRHELLRTADGSSAIDPARSHLNRVLHGLDAGPRASLDALLASGIRPPTAQAESPYLTIVLGASGSYFRPHDPDASGTWDAARLAAFEREALASLRVQFGADLVHVSVHLDETTPHLHALVAPTYARKARVPGRRKRGENEADFEARRDVARASIGVRTIGRASHPVLSRRDSFETLRRSIARDLSPLGIEYGQDRAPTDPDPRSTRKWVADETVRLRDESLRLDRERDALAIQRRALDAVEDDLDRREATVDQVVRVAAREAAEAAAEAVVAVLDGRIVPSPGRPDHVRVDPAMRPRLRPLWSDIGPVITRLAEWWQDVRARLDTFPDAERRAILRPSDDGPSGP